MARVGDGQAARMTLEQLDVEIGLQLLDRLGDGRLRDRQRLRGMETVQASATATKNWSCLIVNAMTELSTNLAAGESAGRAPISATRPDEMPHRSRWTGGAGTESLERDGDRVVYTGNRDGKPFERVGDFLELLDRVCGWSRSTDRDILTTRG